MGRPLILLFVWSFTFLLCPAVSHARDGSEASTKRPDELITDRPDFTESASTVPALRLQLEAGIQYTHQDLLDEAAPAGHTGNYDANSVSAPSLLLRFGVSDWAELRLGVPDISYESITGADDNIIFGEVSLGAKFATSLSDKLNVGVIPFVDVGTETGDVGGGFIAAAAVDLTANVGLGVNAGVTTFEDGLDERQWEWRGSAALGIGLSDDLSAFIETYALIPDGDFNLFVDTGFTYLVAHYVQLDAYLGTQVPDAEEIFAGTGISVLF
ncbi:transporter [Persicimonas caeni]|uniref:Transporter n=1 Tax=Persicimonas caeni TaxID=2292766 RepID=A0A4Y6PY81_PERCE|nr:transporter [Persicimonas caeni]QDG53282.1 transporter [Persicimonas caeni]QED34504.1 transporter [Persicimonas caeni]